MTLDPDFPNRLFRNILSLTEGSLSLEEEELILEALEDVAGFTYYDGEGDEEFIVYTRTPVDDDRSKILFNSLEPGRIRAVINELPA